MKDNAVSEKKSKETGAAAARRVELKLQLSELEIPPVQDALLIGRESPIGMHAIKRMLDAVSPNQYEVFSLEDNETFEAVVVRHSLLRVVSPETLVALLAEEGEAVSDSRMVIRARVKFAVHVSREVELPR